MEFDQYLQPCNDTDIYFLTGYERPKTQPLKVAPRVVTSDVEPPPTRTVLPENEFEREESSPKVNSCFWACSFDNEDAETILTSHMVSK